MFPNAVDGCTKVAHVACYFNMIETEKEGTFLSDTAFLKNPIVCGKRCYTKVMNTQRDA